MSVISKTNKGAKLGNGKTSKNLRKGISQKKREQKKNNGKIVVLENTNLEILHKNTKNPGQTNKKVKGKKDKKHSQNSSLNSENKKLAVNSSVVLNTENPQFHKNRRKSNKRNKKTKAILDEVNHKTLKGSTGIQKKKQSVQSENIQSKKQNKINKSKSKSKLEKLQLLSERKVKQKDKLKNAVFTLDQEHDDSDKIITLGKNHKLNIRKIEIMLASKQANVKTSSNIEGKSKRIEKRKRIKEKSNSGSLREKMMARLRASRFRYLNETLYNNESSQSKKYFKDDPDAFTAYHTGFKQQIEQWPLNPLDVIVSAIKKLPTDHIIADFGCGEAKLAASVPNKVHSFDLVAMNERVTACDMAHTPLLTSSVNTVVFCLSLMGTNLNDYIIEANRVLKKDGILKIAEVESRFEQIEDFIKLLSDYGFVNIWKDLSHNLFYFMDFRKEKDISGKRNKLLPIALKPCLYKKR